MEFREILGGKKEFLSLLLLADEQEDRVDRYLEKGRMFVLDDGGVKCECVVTDEGGGVLEIKNLAVEPAFQRKGCGAAMIEYIAERFRKRFDVLQVGTGDSPATIPFYVKCGFVRWGVRERFFADNYEKPIWEGGVLLVDMIVLRRALRA